jgi:DNA polymerase-1
VRKKIVGVCQDFRCAKYLGPCKWHAKEEWVTVPYTIEESGEETLSALAADGDALAKALLRYRKSVKARDTYGRNWADQFIHTDGRVYSDYRQIGAFTGRMSCGNPNCQQVPHSSDFRSLFIPQDGYDFVDCDYSQIELRICVEMSRDPHGLQAYCVDQTDLHKTTAELILGVDLTDKSEANLARIKEARQVAKSLNFGLIFGAGSETMRRYAMSAFGVALSPEEATRLRNLWRDTYKGIVAWQRRVRDGVETVYTLGGRRRLNVDKFTEKLNTPVQGTGIDGLKAGIALCYERRGEINSNVQPVTYVHDEILMESPKMYSEDVGLWLKKNMQEGMESFLKTVPVLAEPNIISSWGGK